MGHFLFFAPALPERFRFLAQSLELLLDLSRPRLVDGDAVQAVALQGLLLALQGLHGALAVLDGVGLGREQDLHAGRARIEQVDGLVGQLPAGDVAAGELGRGHDGVVAHHHAVGPFVLVLQAAQDQDGRLHVGLVELDELEAPGQGGVLLEIFLVLGPGRCGNGAQLAPGKRRLQQIGRVASAGLAACPDQGVGLVDETG